MKLLNILGVPEEENPMMPLLGPMRAPTDPVYQEPPPQAPPPQLAAMQKAGMQIRQTINPRSPISEAERLSQKDFAVQEAGIKTLQDQKAGLQGPQEMSPWVTMLMGLSDVASSDPNKKLPGYLASQAAAKTAYEDKQQKYQENIQKSQNDLSKERVALYGKQIADQRNDQLMAIALSKTRGGADDFAHQMKVQKLVDNFKKDLDPDAARTGNFGLASQKVMTAQRLETLANAVPGGDLDNRQIEELSLGLANMLAGAGGSSRAQVEGLIPHTWTGKKADVKEWFSSDPYGAGQQEFVKRMMETIGREKDTANQQLNDIRVNRLSSHKLLSQVDPESYKAQLESYGLNPDDYDQRGQRKVKKTAAAHAPATTETAAPATDPTKSAEFLAWKAAKGHK